MYFISITPLFAIFTYAFSNGIVRWYIILFAFIGFILYYFTVGKLLNPVYEYILFLIKIFFEYVKFGIMFPFKKLKKYVKTKVNKPKKSQKSSTNVLKYGK